jgi:hypothetical protein
VAHAIATIIAVFRITITPSGTVAFSRIDGEGRRPELLVKAPSELLHSLVATNPVRLKQLSKVASQPRPLHQRTQLYIHPD